MSKIIETEEDSTTSRRNNNHPLTERVRYGICVRCNSRFTWTGAIPEVPACGNCGRQHTEDDFKKFQMEIQGRDKSEPEVVGNMRQAERRDNKKKSRETRTR